MTVSNMEKTEIGYAHAVKEGKKMKRSDRHLSLSESLRLMDNHFRSVRPIVRR